MLIILSTLNIVTTQVTLQNEFIYSVGIITKLYRSGGIERVTQLLAEHLNKEQIKIFLITGEPTEQDYPVPQNVTRLVAFAENDGNREDAMNEEAKIKTVVKNKLLLEYAKQYNIQLFVCQEHWAHGHYETINFLKDHGIKVVAIEHNFFLFPIHDNREYLYKISQKTYPRLDALVCLSRVDVQLWKHVGVKNAIYIPNILTFDPSQIQPANLQTNKILMVGRFSKDVKQQHLAIYMMSFLKPLYPNAVLQIVGDSSPEYFKECYKQLIRLNVIDNVEFIPFQKNIQEYYKNASVFIMTSKVEGFPMVLQEAKAFGIPVVAFDLKFCELWQEGVTTVWQGDVESMAKQVARLLKDKELRDQKGQEARDSLNKFKTVETVKKWVKLIKSIIDEDQREIQEMMETQEKVTYEHAVDVLKHELNVIGREGYDFGFNQ
ncbi:Glycosyl_transferases group [Hexamita inflata]|uniref:Glycosyl transferases group n=1 Tax=Hexamita inflata TaxID=28002 RepID=A0AA86U643_9EUKA|nr:Glycosyl transferases group [Hexamita inflata]CAI9939222.1 Glycosyl transferases group [Hexamita inflata]